jgi:dGTP triphosphohydrolase
LTQGERARKVGDGKGFCSSPSGGVCDRSRAVAGAVESRVAFGDADGVSAGQGPDCSFGCVSAAEAEDAGFGPHEGDHYRTRLTLAGVRRWPAARLLGLDEDLAETLSLAHDIGHPPFGHAGETALNGAMEAYGGFDHNAQALRVLTKLEHRYPAFDGLNLTWESLEGVIKHNGPLVTAGKPLASLPAAFRDYEALQSLGLDTFAGPEAQVAALADDIAYNNHDIQDSCCGSV